MEPLVFIHLSDIHFSKPGKLFDLDSELRNQLELDVQRMTKNFEGGANGILVCGDIAFSGSTKSNRKQVVGLRSYSEWQRLRTAAFGWCLGITI